MVELKTNLSCYLFIYLCFLFEGLKTSTLIPYAIVGTLMIISGLLVLLLPETRKQVLTDRIRSKKTSGNNDEQQNIVNDDQVLESSI
jgi:competence protein ComGC